MTNDRVRPSRHRAEQDRAIGGYLRHQVGPYSPFYRQSFAQAGVDLTRIRGTADLANLPFTALADVDDPASLVLRPEPDHVLANGEPGLRWTMRAATLFGRGGAAAKNRIDPLYKPVHWVVAGDGLPLGYAPPDLERLAELGRRWLEQAGLQPTDVLVSILPPGPDVAFWQLQLGARRGGVSALLLDSEPQPAELQRLQPTVLAGRPADLARLLERGMAEQLQLAGLTTVLAVGERLSDGSRERLRELAAAVAPSEPAVVAAWAPPGARAVWAECRGGNAFHTWPDSEVVEVVDGEVVWTALGWRGSVLVRLRTGIAGTLDDGICPTCRRTTPRVDRQGEPDR